MCDYNTEESMSRSRKKMEKKNKIYCETNNKIYNTKKELAKESEKDFGIKISMNKINRMLERSFNTDTIKIRYVEGGEMDE